MPKWAANRVKKMGPLSWNEIVLVILVFTAILFWIFGAAFINPTVVALVAVTLMIILKIVKWDDIAGNKTAWNTVVLLAFLVSLAEGLSRTGFIQWFDNSVKTYTQSFRPSSRCTSL